MSIISGDRFWLPLDKRIGPAACISPAQAAEIIERAMKRAEGGNAALGQRGPRRHWPRMLLASAAAVALPATVVAGALRWVGSREQPGPTVITWQAPATRIGPQYGGRVPPLDPVEQPVDSMLGKPPPVEASAAEKPIRDMRTTKTRVSAPLPARQSAQEMLQQANDLRAKRQWLEATRVYEQALRNYPGGAEAYSAMVAAGSLRLDHLGDPRGALALFAGALRTRPGGALSEESHWGKIQAQRALGDAGAERASLEEFLRLYPQSLLAPRAHSRIRELLGEAP